MIKYTYVIHRKNTTTNVFNIFLKNMRKRLIGFDKM